MPLTPHIEKHFTASATVRDIVIGMADGLTVPFALAAALSGAVQQGQTFVIIAGGLAEIAAGSIAMGLGGYLAAKTDAEHYATELEREKRETVELPDVERAEVAHVFQKYGLDDATVETIVNAVCSDQKRWIDFMMRFELGLDEPDPRRARVSAWTIALSYVAGGMVPLGPYFLPIDVHPALFISVCVTLAALFVFGYLKGRFTANRPLRSAWHTVAVGGIAAAAAYVIATLIGGG